MRVFLSLGILLLLNGCIFQPKPINVLFVGTFKGKFSDLAVSARNAIQLELDRINNEGGIKGHRIYLTVLNDQGGTTKALNKLEADLQTHKFRLVLGPTLSVTAVREVPLFNKYQIPAIGITVSTPELAGKDDFFLRVTPIAVWQATLIARDVEKESKEGKVGVIYDIQNSNYTLPLVCSFTNALGSNYKKRLVLLPFESDHADRLVTSLDPVVDSLRSIVFVASALDTADIVQKYAKRLKKSRLFSSLWAFNSALIEYGGRAVDGIRFFGSFDEMDPHPDFQDFKRRYLKRYESEPDFVSVYAADAVRVMESVLKEDPRLKGQELKNHLRGRTYQSLTGELKMDFYGEVERPHMLFVVSNGQFVRMAQ